MASIWGGDNPSVAWNENSWQSNTITVSLTGLATSSVGSVAAFQLKKVGVDNNGEILAGV
jgi:glycine cleavage system H lipoate-binding protein